MNKSVHHNFIISSNLFFITAGLGLVNIFLTRDTLSNDFNTIIAVFTIAFLIGIGLFVRQGFLWVRNFLLIIIILGLIGIPLIFRILLENPIVGTINIMQTVLQVWAVVLVFKIPKIKTP